MNFYFLNFPSNIFKTATECGELKTSKVKLWVRDSIYLLKRLDNHCLLFLISNFQEDPQELVVYS